MEHTYPSKYPKGSHWATDMGWEMLDRLKPGLIPDEIRAYICGYMAASLMKVAAEGAPKQEMRANVAKEAKSDGDPGGTGGGG